MDNLTSIAASKINLFLKVTGRRPDGYHDIETLFLPLKNPADVISVIESSEEGIRIVSDDLEIPHDSGNICWKAADKYAVKSGVKPHWDIKVFKEIPVAAGMGGGSSDAATVIELLNKKYNALSPAELKQIALETGADVPFFLNPKPAIARGVGEELVNIDLKNVLNEIPLLIAAPCFPVSAKWAYTHADWRNISAPRGGMDALIEALLLLDWEKCGRLIHNDLGIAVMKKFPLLQMIKETLQNSKACGVEVTGSGPTLFAIFKTKSDAVSASSALNSKFGESVRVFLN